MPIELKQALEALRRLLKEASGEQLGLSEKGGLYAAACVLEQRFESLLSGYPGVRYHQEILGLVGNARFAIGGLTGFEYTFDHSREDLYNTGANAIDAADQELRAQEIYD